MWWPAPDRFGSALVSGGVGPADYWAGSEYLVQPRDVAGQVVSSGFSAQVAHDAVLRGARHRRLPAAMPISTPGETSSSTSELQAPAGLPCGEGTFVKVDVSAVGSAHAAWANPASAYFRLSQGGWSIVGLERTAE